MTMQLVAMIAALNYRHSLAVILDNFEVIIKNLKEDRSIAQ